MNQAQVSPELMHSAQHFYHNEEWQQWSFHNHEHKMLDKLVWATHKLPLKQWIFDFHNDLEYYQGKIKVKSAHNSWGYQLGIDDRFNVICFGVLSASKCKMNQKYGDTLGKFVRE